MSADKSAQAIIRAMCRAQDFRFLHAESCQTAQQVSVTAPDLILLHSNISDISDTDLFVLLRRSGCMSPVILISENGEEARVVQALDLGVSDYIMWPCGIAELIARIRRTLRRGSHTSRCGHRVQLGELKVDFDARSVTVGERIVKLTRKETELLGLLVSNPGKVLTQPFILARVWGTNTDAQYLRYYISRLRSKLKQAAHQRTYIETIAGVGYRFLLPHGSAYASL